MARLMFGWYFEVDAWLRFWTWHLIKICVWTCDMNSTLGSVVPLAMFLTIQMPVLFALSYHSSSEGFSLSFSIRHREGNYWHHVERKKGTIKEPLKDFRKERKENTVFEDPYNEKKEDHQQRCERAKELLPLWLSSGADTSPDAAPLHTSPLIYRYEPSARYPTLSALNLCCFQEWSLLLLLCFMPERRR